MKTEIIEKGIYGIKNPKMIVKLNMKINNYDFEIRCDGKNIKDFECIALDDSKNLILKVNIPFKSKKIEVYAVEKKKKSVICVLRNFMLARMVYKVRSFFRVIISKIKVVLYVLYKGIKFMWKEYHFLVPISMWKKYIHDFKERIHSNGDRYYNPFYKDEYKKWLKNNKAETEYKTFKYNPLISILIPVYNIDRKFLSECLDSILEQSYNNFEVCLVDDCSTKKETKETLDKYKKKDERIRVNYRKENGHISKTTNDALKMAKGEFVGLMDDDDLLDKDALYRVVEILNKNKKLDFIYSDEDKLDIDGDFCEPNFKPDFSPDTLLSLNYICHFTVMRKNLVKKVGGFESGLDGAQDYDMFLKVTEQTNNIYHIPQILYHWRMVEGSTSMTISNKSYATDKGKQAIQNALKRRKINAHVEKDLPSTYYRVYYDLKKEPLVSIIIPTKDLADTLEKCLISIYKKTTYKNYEIIVANNNSEQKETFDLFREYKKKHKNFNVVDVNIPFNYSKINNIAISKSKGDYVVLLNNDTEIISDDWLSNLIGYASQKHVGVVGAKLFYPDMTVQHAGVILGLGGVASHAYIGASKDDFGMYGRLRVPYDYSANTAACIAIKKSLYEEVNGLEEQLEVAYNDIDFNMKVLSKGYYNVFLPQVELIHYESKSRGLDTTSEKYKRFLFESKFMYKKWNEVLNNDPFYNPNFSKKGWFMLDKKTKE